MNKDLIKKLQPECIEAFKRYATRTAFNISLTKNQVDALRRLKVHAYTPRHKRGGFEQFCGIAYGVIKSLQTKGLVDNKHRLTFIGERIFEIIDLCGWFDNSTEGNG